MVCVVKDRGCVDVTCDGTVVSGSAAEDIVLGVCSYKKVQLTVRR